MKVLAVRSFTARLSDGESMHVVAGDEIELPEGVDWLKAGLVVELDEGPETAAKAAPAERATKRKPRKKAE